MEDGGSFLGLKRGDLVLMPCGMPGVVTDFGLFGGGHALMIHIRPIAIKWWRYLYLELTGRLNFYNEQIYTLENLEPQLLAPSEG